MTKPKQTDPPEGGRSGENLNVWIVRTLVQALRRYVAGTKPRTTKTAVVEEALQEYLQARGYWPPSNEEG